MTDQSPLGQAVSLCVRDSLSPLELGSWFSVVALRCFGLSPGLFVRSRGLMAQSESLIAHPFRCDQP